MVFAIQEELIRRLTDPYKICTDLPFPSRLNGPLYILGEQTLAALARDVDEFVSIGKILF